LLVNLGCFTTLIYANTNPNNLKQFCAEQINTSITGFKNFAQAAHNIRQDFCDDNTSLDQLEKQIIDSVKFSKSGFDLLEGKVTLNDGEHFNFEHLYSQILITGYMTGISNISVTPYGNNLEIKYGHKTLAKINRTSCDTVLSSSSTNCLNFLTEFQDVYTFAHQTLASPLALKHHAYLLKLGKSFDDFIKKSRSQMPWEMLLNGWNFQQKQTPGIWSEPPESQIILFHPSIVIENVSDALDGENTEHALMIEVIGYNRWQSDRWYTPTGLSLITLSADRNQTKDWGLGVAVHFDNNLSLGFSKHDDQNGVFVSVDLWKLFTDKQSILKSYGF
jgi:hypothetical protein